MEELKKCPFCGHEIDEQKDLYLPERDWHPTFYDPDSGGRPYIHTLRIVKEELALETHDRTTKDDLLMLLDWTYNRLIKGDLEVE